MNGGDHGMSAGGSRTTSEILVARSGSDGESTCAASCMPTSGKNAYGDTAVRVTDESRNVP